MEDDVGEPTVLSATCKWRGSEGGGSLGLIPSNSSKTRNSKAKGVQSFAKIWFFGEVEAKTAAYFLQYFSLSAATK